MGERLQLEEVAGHFAIQRLKSRSTRILASVIERVQATAGFWSLTVTPEEVSLIAEEHCLAPSEDAERGWVLFRVPGPLPFEAVGIAARLTQPLAEAQVSVLVVATHDTDYLLVKAIQREAAIAAWRNAQVEVRPLNPAR